MCGYSAGRVRYLRICYRCGKSVALGAVWPPSGRCGYQWEIHAARLLLHGNPDVFGRCPDFDIRPCPSDERRNGNFDKHATKAT